jgi:hypothetical protein
MSPREQPSKRRLSETFELTAGGLEYTCTFSQFPEDGRLAEIFLTNHKYPGSHADTNARDSAIVCSLALQHGTDLEVIRRALCRADGKACGPLGVALDRIAEIGAAHDLIVEPP